MVKKEEKAIKKFINIALGCIEELALSVNDVWDSVRSSAAKK